MAIKNYSKKIIFWVLVITITSCSKYERTNPNDILGSNGTPILAIDGYKVISDNNGDAKLQKNETATLSVLVNNTGTKLTQLTSAIFTSNSTKLVIENFILENTMMCYVGKTNSIGNLRIKVASNANVGEMFTCNVKLTDKAGNVFNTTLNLTVSDFKPSNLSFNSVVFEGFEDAVGSTRVYTKVLTPYIRMEINNNANTEYNDYLNFTITSLDAQYPYQYSNKFDAIIPSSNAGNFEFPLDCLPQYMPDNYNLVLNVAITDKFGGSIEKQITVKMFKNLAKLDFTSFEIWNGGLNPGSLVFIDCVVKNSGGRVLAFSQSGAKISTTSSYLDDLSIQITNGTISQNETSNNLVSFSAAIASNCPVGTKIPVTIELTSNESCPTKFTSVVQLVVE